MKNGPKVMKMLQLMAVLTLTFVPFLDAYGQGRRPGYVFSAEKEDMVNELEGLGTGQVLERIQGVEFIVDEYMMNEAIMRSFDRRRVEVINADVVRIGGIVVGELYEEVVVAGGGGSGSS